ncbi:ATP-binding cassette domain-containing protein [uncultured Ruminococcus sp.]|uniref:ATP-binding cassette domain-containing protein n=1 Tax=uncultured Ruminococcus sp. TaxID=165186 RepID=UPI0025ED5507|nr:ATP-binding cassette domain-containing protein [uncultured Ruminococcus sp.]
MKYMCLIKCHGISKEVSVGTHKKYILKDINLDIEEAEYIAVIGHSGSGKSSLMNNTGFD